jgi:mRNA-degrading endonuclease RelE of RelBE toxin-antitoxin system
MPYQILLHPKADKTLKSFEEQLQKRIKQKIRILRDQPRSGELLKGSKFFSLREGDYRIIYEIKIDPPRIIILFIGHRSVVYDNFLKWLS